MKDDQCLVLESSRGLVVVLGCAHSGTINTLNWVKENLPAQKIHMLIGGTHIGFLSEKQISKTIEQLKGFSIDRVGVSHCTGLAASVKLHQALGESFFFANAGSVIEI